jgi:hypothetical protein
MSGRLCLIRMDRRSAAVVTLSEGARVLAVAERIYSLRPGARNTGPAVGWNEMGRVADWSVSTERRDYNSLDGGQWDAFNPRLARARALPAHMPFAAPIVH